MRSASLAITRLVVLSALAISASSASASAQETAADILKRAHAASSAPPSEASLTDVIDMCDKALAMSPRPQDTAYANKLKAWALDRRGELRSAAGDEEAALKDFEESIKLDGTSWRALHNRGVSRATLGQAEAAAADFSEVIRRNPDYPNAWHNLAELHHQANRLDQAIAAYGEGLRRKPNDGYMLLGRGYSYFRRGNYREALNDFNAVLRVDPRNAQAMAYRGDAYVGLRRYSEAGNDFRTAIQIDPNLAQAYAGAAWLMATCPDARLRNPQLALPAAEKAIELGGEVNFRYVDTLAAAYASLGQFDKAVSEQEKAVNLGASQQPNAVEGLEYRLELYRNKTAYRDGSMPRG